MENTLYRSEEDILRRAIQQLLMQKQAAEAKVKRLSDVLRSKKMQLKQLQSGKSPISISNNRMKKNIRTRKRNGLL